VKSAALLLELGGVLLVLALLARLALRIGLTPVPLYLLAGLALGEGGVLEVPQARGFAEDAAAIGVVLLLLTLGLEYRGEELVAGLRTSLPSGVVDLVLNATPGVLAGFILGWSPLAAVLLGGVTYISSSGIVAKVLADLGRLGNRETPAVLAVLVLEDLAMAVYLPVVAALLVGGTALAVTGAVVVAVTAALVALFIAVRFGPALSRLLFSGSGEVLLLTVLGLALVVAGLAEELAVGAAVGAFLVGLALSGPAAEAAQPLVAPLRDLFAAAFFLFFGMEVDPGTLGGAIVPAVVLAVVTAGTKVVTGWFAAARMQVATRGRLRAGTALVARGEFSIVIAGLGLAAGIEDDLGGLAAAYVLILAVAGPVLTRFADQLTPRRTRTPT
jgi:CPA2 family monovalent cation:H+ antiporter-2